MGSYFKGLYNRTVPQLFGEEELRLMDEMATWLEQMGYSDVAAETHEVASTVRKALQIVDARLRYRLRTVWQEAEQYRSGCVGTEELQIEVLRWRIDRRNAPQP